MPKEDIINIVLNALMFIVFGGGATKVSKMLTERIKEVVTEATSEIVQAQHETTASIQGLTHRVSALEERTQTDG